MLTVVRWLICSKDINPPYTVWIMQLMVRSYGCIDSIELSHYNPQVLKEGGRVIPISMGRKFSQLKMGNSQLEYLDPCSKQGGGAKVRAQVNLASITIISVKIW